MKSTNGQDIRMLFGILKKLSKNFEQKQTIIETLLTYYACNVRLLYFTQDTKLNDAQNSDSNLSSLFEKIRDKAERELEAFKKESNDLYQKNVIILY
jgi:hypothetical protein